MSTNNRHCQKLNTNNRFTLLHYVRVDTTHRYKRNNGRPHKCFTIRLVTMFTTPTYVTFEINTYVFCLNVSARIPKVFYRNSSRKHCICIYVLMYDSMIFIYISSFMITSFFYLYSPLPLIYEILCAFSCNLIRRIRSIRVSTMKFNFLYIILAMVHINLTFMLRNNGRIVYFISNSKE